MPIFGPWESQNIWRAKTKNKRVLGYADNLQYIILLLFVQRRRFTFSSSGAAIKSAHSSRIEASTVPSIGDLGVLISLISGVWGGAPVANVFLKIFD